MAAHETRWRRRLVMGASFIFLVVVLLFLLLSVGLTLLTATQAGSQWLLRQGQAYLPGQLKLGHTEGDLVSGLTLTEVDYRLKELHVHMDSLRLRWRPAALLRRNLHIEQLQVRGLELQLPDTAGQGGGAPAAILLPLSVALDDGRIRDIRVQRGQQQWRLDTLHLSASAGLLYGLEIKTLSLRQGQARGRLNGKMSLRRPYDYHGQLHWEAALGDQMKANGQASLEGDMNTLNIRHQLNNPVNVQTRGRVMLDQGQPVFHLQGRWQRLRWPLTDKPDYLSPQGDYSLDGRLDDYRFKLAGPLQLAGLPDSHASIQGTGNLAGLQLEKVQLNGLDGVLSGKGKLNWSGGFGLSLAIHGEGLDPGRHWPAFPGKLGLDTHLNITTRPAGTEVELKHLRLQGRLRRQPVSLRGGLSWFRDVLAIQQARGSLGKNRLSLSGSLQQDRGLDVRLDARDLGSLWPSLSGRLNASGHLHGSLAQLSGNLKLQGSEFTYGGLGAQRLSGSASLDGQRPERSRARLTADGVSLAGQLFSRLQLSAHGWLARHRASLTLAGDQGTASLRLAGGYDQGLWSGALQQADLKLASLGDWHLAAPVPLTLGPHHAGPAHACWDSNQRQLCLDGVWSGDTARLSLDGHSTEGNSQGQVQLTGLSGNHPGIDGQLVLELPDIRFLQPLLDPVTLTSGQLTARIKVTGELASPRVTGETSLTGAAARVPELGLELQQIRLDGEARGQQLSLSGSAVSGEGKLAVNGAVMLQPAFGWPFSFSLKGQQFAIVRLPDMDISANPDLKVQGSLKQVDVSGTVLLPHAHVRLRKLPPDVVRVSEDQVIVGAEPAEQQAPRIPLQLNVVASLGDDAHFEGLGLETDLSGNLNLRSLQSRTLIGNGVLELHNGRYEGYGQKLAIQQGHLLFAGPLDNPELDVRATREEGDVTAGLELTGSAKSPQLNLFSQPAMSDAEVMSYLVTGKPLAASTSSSDSQALAAAAASLGINNPISQEISQALGVDIGVESGASDAETSVMVGKQLSSRLRVDYLYGMFTETAMVRFVYKLGKYLSLTGQSGAQQAIDLNYSISRP